MSVHRLPPTSVGKVRHQVRWRENGRNRSRNFDRRADANAFDAEVTRLRQAGELDVVMRARTLTVADYADDWWDRHSPGLAQSTREMYAHQLDKRVMPSWGEWPLRAVTPSAVERWISQMRGDDTGDPTILKAVTVLQAMLSSALRDELVTRNAARDARKPRQRRTREPVMVHPSHVELIRAYLQREGRHRDAVLVSALAYAGLRPESEALPLRWRHVRSGSLLVIDTKRDVERSVRLLDHLRHDLNEWRLAQGRPAGERLVFPTSAGTPWKGHDWDNWRDRIFRPAALASGLPFDTRPRDMRSSLASLLIHEGRTIVEVASQLGHSPETCLRDYARVFDDVDPARRKPADEQIAEARTFALRSLTPNTDDSQEAS